MQVAMTRGAMTGGRLATWLDVVKSIPVGRLSWGVVVSPK